MSTTTQMRNLQIKTFFVGIGNIFCQGIDLFYLCHDHQEKRKELASEMANGKSAIFCFCMKTYIFSVKVNKFNLCYCSGIEGFLKIKCTIKYN